MRILSTADLHKLGKHARAQLTPLLTETLSKSSYPGIGKQCSQRTGKHGIDPVTKLRFCHYPPQDTAVKFHIALENRYGRISEGGYIVSEMLIETPGNNYRYDWAHLGAKVTFEFDGYEAHRRLDDFNKDRAKHRTALEYGWLQIPVTNRDVTQSLGALMDQIDVIIRQRNTPMQYVKPKGFTQCVWLKESD